jgi:hypothetical protein
LSWFFAAFPTILSYVQINIKSVTNTKNKHIHTSQREVNSQGISSFVNTIFYYIIVTRPWFITLPRVSFPQLISEKNDQLARIRGLPELNGIQKLLVDCLLTYDGLPYVFKTNERYHCSEEGEV